MLTQNSTYSCTNVPWAAHEGHSCLCFLHLGLIEKHEMVNSSVKFYQFFVTFFKKVGNRNFSSPLLGKRLLLFCFFSSEMCLGMDHVMEVSSYCVLRKSHCARGWSDICFHWVVFLFSGVLCSLVLWGFFFPFRVFSWDMRQERRW